MTKITDLLYQMGQSLWLDNVTRGLLDGGTLQRYIKEESVTGLTSNPTIFDHAIKNSNFYDTAIAQKVKQGKSGEHGTLGRILSSGGGDAEELIFKMSRLGIDMDALAAQLQKEGAESFVKSWNELMGVLASKAQSFK